MTFGFDANLFEAELEVAASSSNKGGGSRGSKKRQNFIEHPGIRMSIKDTGLFYKKPNKRGVIVEKTAKQVRGVVLDSKFTLSQWGKEDMKPKMICSAIAHTNPDGSEGNGVWQIPLRMDSLTERLNPQGFKGMSCMDCVAAKENTGCKQSGGVHVYVTGLDHGETNSDDEYIGIQDVEPFIAHISTSGMSALQYTNFLLELRRLPNKPAVETVEAIFSTQDNPRAPVKMLKIDVGNPFSEVADAKKTMTEAIKQLEEASAKRYEEWKAKNGVKKTTTGSGSTVDQDDDLPF